MNFTSTKIDSSNKDYFLQKFELVKSNMLIACIGSLEQRTPDVGLIKFWVDNLDNADIFAVGTEDDLGNLYMITLLSFKNLNLTMDTQIYQELNLNYNLINFLEAHRTLALYLLQLGFETIKGCPTGKFKDYILKLPNVQYDGVKTVLDLRRLNV